jgi:dTDP-4-amino-4,6-dideoxygalactose transaminase
VRETFLPFALPLIGQEEIDEVVDTLKSGWITTGPKTQRFEEKFRNYIGSAHALAVSSCTAGLHLALAALGVGAGDEVITSTLTFCATANVIIHLGATPVLADIKDDLNIDLEEVTRRITPKTRSIIPVHIGGHPCNMDALLRIARENNLFVVEDAAHAVGARYKGRKIGTLSEAAAFSFYPIKNMTTAEGGMVTTNREDLAEKMRVLSLHGISKDAWKRYTDKGSWYYEVLEAGYKYNMTDLQASLGIHQLDKLEDFIKTRKRYADIFTRAFKELEAIEVPPEDEATSSAWHLYAIKLNLNRLTIDRERFIEELRAENIGSSVHFIPLHRHPYYRQRWGFKAEDFPVAEEAYKRIVSLPLYPRMTEGDVEDVIAAVQRVVVKHST